MDMTQYVETSLSSYVLVDCTTSVEERKVLIKEGCSAACTIIVREASLIVVVIRVDNVGEFLADAILTTMEGFFSILCY